LLLIPVQSHILPLQQIPLYALIRGVPLCAEVLDEGLGLFDIRKANELAPQFYASVLTVNAAASLGIQ